MTVAYMEGFGFRGVSTVGACRGSVSGFKGSNALYSCVFPWLGFDLRYAVTLLQRAHIAKNATDSTNATKIVHKHKNILLSYWF
jgi:hypothetical protein